MDQTDASSIKAQLLSDMHSGREKWDALLARVVEAARPGQLEEPALDAGWSIKDLIAHVETYERWMTMLLNAGGPDIPHPVDGMTQHETNAWILEQNRGRSLDEVLSSSRRTFDDLVAAVTATSPGDLVSTTKFEWAGSRPMYTVIPRESYTHYEDHIPALETWLQNHPANAE